VAPALGDLEAELGSDSFLDDPYPVYRLLRAEAPVYPSEAWNGWLLTRYDDVKRVLEQPDAFSSADRVRPRLEPVLPPAVWEALNRLYGRFSGFFWSDPPEYTAHRARWTHGFRPRLACFETRVQELVDGLLDEATARGGAFDLVRDLAHPLPATVVFELLGVPAEDRPRFKAWGDRLIALANLPESRTIDAALHAMDEAGAWARDLLAERRARPRGDMLSDLLADVDLTAMTDEEVRVLVVTLIQFLLAGHETTTSVIGSGALALLRDPDTREELQRDPELVPAAVEEFLRLESPLQYLTRRAARDVELRGQRIAHDELVLVVLGSANRDEAQFVRPDELDVHRRPNRHLAFGFNVHFCLGAPLARLEARIAFETLLRRFPELRLAGEPRWRRNAMFRALETLPVALDQPRSAPAERPCT
jgi:pimeloyl-[acyl-carrier protein] synthase